MKILHLFSNWKWTGPAEHALNLALTLKKFGHEVCFACGAPPPDVPDSLAACAAGAGLSPVTSFKLNKHFNIFSNLSDIPALRSFIKREKFDIVHTHLPNDHFIAGMALRSTFSKIPIIRSCYEGDGIRGGVETRLLFSLMTDGLVTISEKAKTRIANRKYLSPAKIWKVDVPVDLQKFDPDKTANNRAKFNLSQEALVGGIVARVQKHRRFEVLLEALEMVVREFPNFKFMVIGRGTYIQEIAIKPSQNMGIRTNLIFTGYKKDDFRETLACLNFKIFLVPGTDGACRAVREAMAMRIPVIAANRGMLPELIENSIDGLIIDDKPEEIAKAILHIVENPDLRCRMAENAYQKSRRLFDLNIQTQKIEAIYESVLMSRKKKK
ncbi:MAG: glycosyltransferase family 4 protein [Pseudomonadota bacterium]